MNWLSYLYNLAMVCLLPLGVNEQSPDLYIGVSVVTVMLVYLNSI